MKLSKRKKNVTKYNLKTEKDHPLGIITISRKYVAIVAQLLGDLTTIPLKHQPHVGNKVKKICVDLNCDICCFCLLKTINHL